MGPLHFGQRAGNKIRIIDFCPFMDFYFVFVLFLLGDVAGGIPFKPTLEGIIRIHTIPKCQNDLIKYILGNVRTSLPGNHSSKVVIACSASRRKHVGEDVTGDVTGR